MITIAEVLLYSKDLNVLYVEDNKIVLESTSNLLENYFNSLDVAEDGESGLDMYLQSNSSDTPYDLVITDINMPKMNGLDMSREILKVNPNQAIVITSGESKYLENAKDIGITDFIVKPVLYEQLSMNMLKISKEIYNGKLNRVL